MAATVQIVEKNGAVLFLVLVWARSAVAVLSTVAVHAQHLVARWKSLGFQQAVEPVPATSSSFGAMFIPSAVDVVEGKKHNFSLPTAGAHWSAVGGKRIHTKLINSLPSGNLTRCDVLRVRLPVSRFWLDPKGLLFVSPCFSFGRYFNFVRAVFSIGFNELGRSVARLAYVPAVKACRGKMEVFDSFGFPASFAGA